VDLVSAAAGDGSNSELEGAAGDVHVLVLHAHRVDAHLLGNKLDAVAAVVQAHDVTQLRHARW